MPSERQIQHYGQYGLQACSPGNSLLFLGCTQARQMRGTARGVEVKLDPPRRQPPQRIVLHLPKSRPAIKTPNGVSVVYRPDEARRWDFPAVIEAYQKLPASPILEK